MSSNEHERDDETMIAGLLKAAGRGPTASEQARKRVYNAVHAEWRSSVVSTPSGRQGHGQPAEVTGRWLRRWLLRGVPVAAAILVAVVVLNVTRTPVSVTRTEVASAIKTLGAVTVVEPDGAPGIALEASRGILRVGDALVTSDDGAASLALSNGINVRVDSSSEVVLAAADSIDVRRGTVYLDTGRGDTASGNTGAVPAADLEIVTRFGNVRHRGTQYEVRVGTNNLRIRVREGAVGYRNDGVELVGEAGEQLMLMPDAQAVRTAIETTGPEWAWVEDLAAAPQGDQHQILELLEWAARETGRELQFASDDIAAMAQSDTLFGIAGLTPAETLQVIASTTELRYEAAGDSLLIY